MAIWNDDVAYVALQAQALKTLAEEHGFPLYLANAVIFGGWATARTGDAEAGVKAISEGTTRLQATGSQMLQTIFLSFLADAQERAGRPQEALATVQRALGLVSDTGEFFYEAELRRLRGELFLLGESGLRRDVAKAEFDRALSIAQSQGAVSLSARATASRAKLDSHNQQPA